MELLDILGCPSRNKKGQSRHILLLASAFRDIMDCCRRLGRNRAFGGLKNEKDWRKDLENNVTQYSHIFVKVAKVIVSVFLL